MSTEAEKLLQRLRSSAAKTNELLGIKSQPKKARRIQLGNGNSPRIVVHWAEFEALNVSKWDYPTRSKLTAVVTHRYVTPPVGSFDSEIVIQHGHTFDVPCSPSTFCKEITVGPDEGHGRSTLDWSKESPASSI